VLELVEKLAISEDKYLRLNAEFDNFRKRASRERNDVRVTTQFEVLNSVVPVLDHFEFAMSSVEQSHNLEKLFEGMKLIKTEFEKALTGQGVELIDALGQPFDPRFHEGIAHEDSEEFEKDMVSKQWRLGYKIGDRVMRPATVVISNGKKQPEGNDK
jgi:molecular chaperone GrpE